MNGAIKALLIGDDLQLTSVIGSITNLDRNQTVTWSFEREREWSPAAELIDVIVVDERKWTGEVRSQLQRLRTRVGPTPIVLLCEPQTALLGPEVLGVSSVQLVDRNEAAGLLPSMLAWLGAATGAHATMQRKPPNTDMREDSAPPALSASEPAPDRELAHVLLVEDNEADVVLTQLLLQETDGLQFHIHSVSNGELALQWLTDTDNPSIDLILLDINMPVMDGFTFLQALRGQQRYAHTPVIMCSTSDEPGDLTKARKFGVAAYVTKPVRLEQIEEPLRDIETLALHRDRGETRLERRRRPQLPLST